MTDNNATDLVIQENTDYMLGLEEMRREDMQLPWWNIGQPTSQTVSKGYFGNSLTGEEAEEMRIVPLYMKRSRIHFGASFGDPIVCKSSDGKSPDMKVEEPVCERCEEVRQDGRVYEVCPAAQWADGDEEGERIPPTCDLTKNLIFVDHNGGNGIISFRKTALKSLNGLLSYAMQRRKPLCSFSALMRLDERKNSRGVYYVPRFTGYKDIADETELARYMSIARELGSYRPDEG